MHLKYRILNAPSAYTIDRAAELGCNWAIVHSAGIEGSMRDPETGREADMFPIYFESYPNVARIRHDQDAAWIEPLRREVAALCERAAGHDLKVAFHMYEPVLPLLFEQEYPDIVGTWLRPTQAGTVTVHSCLDPDDAATWELIRSKYAELAREFPWVDMFILTTWDGSGTYWCIPQAEMPIAQRLTRMVEAAREGVQSERSDCRVCFRLWGRNWPRQMYLDGHRLIAEVTGVRNASELMERAASPHNDPEKVLPAVFAALPDDVPIMYKSTNIDIADGQPLTLAAGKYPHDREQIIEISYEQYHKKPWPWCKLQHIRKGLDAARDHGLAGFVALPVNMGNNDRASSPDAGNLGRMNTWLLARLLEDDDRSDAELVAAWLMEQFGSPQPAEAVQALLDADDIVDKGIQWGGGVPCRTPFGSLHTTKLYWMFDGFADPTFPFRMAKPDRTTLDGMIEAKHTAHERAQAAIARIKAARAAVHADLYEELKAALTMLADSILLRRDWDSYLLVQYGIERGLYPADRVNLGRMSRYVERFVASLARLRDTEAGRYALSRLPGPDPFPLT